LSTKADVLATLGVKGKLTRSASISSILEPDREMAQPRMIAEMLHERYSE
jgi:hypothetical protein